MTDIKQRLQDAIDSGSATGPMYELVRDTLAEIERVHTFRRNVVASAAAALDSRSNSRCVAALEEIFRNGSRL